MLIDDRGRPSQNAAIKAETTVDKDGEQSTQGRPETLGHGTVIWAVSFLRQPVEAAQIRSRPSGPGYSASSSLRRGSTSR